MNLKRRHTHLTFGCIMAGLLVGSVLEIVPSPASIEMELLMGTFALIGLILYRIELLAEQAQEAIKAVHGEL